ncbi:YggT family protein [Sporolactobacillus sp. CQH2019]|uniref:YggT family protein n=1 Tax=Sporolactobacillus sp. CQH2019 TaxID=3023512 RepID=UPI00236870CD|nr:YggT family protein [Sporolactobacillus sp. CQH2019]MDD9147145.1 YggT family protein [Sporolactobacillus sp. CQH2019]
MYLIAVILSQAINIFKWILIIYILMSWLPNLQNSQVGQLFAKICEPFLEPFRRIIPPIGGVLDISPIAAFVVLWFAQIGIANLATMFG